MRKNDVKASVRTQKRLNVEKSTYVQSVVSGLQKKAGAWDEDISLLHMVQKDTVASVRRLRNIVDDINRRLKHVEATCDDQPIVNDTVVGKSNPKIDVDKIVNFRGRTYKVCEVFYKNNAPGTLILSLQDLNEDDDGY